LNQDPLDNCKVLHGWLGLSCELASNEPPVAKFLGVHHSFLVVRPQPPPLAKHLFQVLCSSPAVDALHVAVAAFGGVKYLLTLNCKHIANAHELPRVYQLLRDEGFGTMLICTPSEFLGGDDDD